MPVRAGRGWAYSRQGTASRVFPLRHSFQAVSPTGTLHIKHGCRLRHALSGPEQEISSPAVAGRGYSNLAFSGRVMRFSNGIAASTITADRANPPTMVR
jgi:hypothetical protein